MYLLFAPFKSHSEVLKNNNNLFPFVTKSAIITITTIVTIFYEAIQILGPRREPRTADKRGKDQMTILMLQPYFNARKTTSATIKL